MSSDGTFLPFLGTMPIIDTAVQMGNGAAAAVTGQQYNVYRLSDSSTGSIFDQSPFYTNFPMYIKRASKGQIENDTFNIQVYVGTCDNRQLELGDVLVEQGYESEAGNVFVFAQKRPVNWTFSSLFVRCEANISITRSQPRGGQSGQQPPSGVLVQPGYGGVDKQGEWGATLQQGGYFFTVNQLLSLAAVPANLQPLNRIRDGNDIKIPSAFYREHFTIWVPLLPGIQLQEFDVLNFPNSDRYRIASVYTSEATGLIGYTCICEKQGT